MQTKTHKHGKYAALLKLTKKSTMEELELALKEGGVEMDCSWFSKNRVWIVGLENERDEFSRTAGVAKELARAIVGAASDIVASCEAEAPAGRRKVSGKS